MTIFSLPPPILRYVLELSGYEPNFKKVDKKHYTFYTQICANTCTKYQENETVNNWIIHKNIINLSNFEKMHKIFEGLNDQPYSIIFNKVKKTKTKIVEDNSINQKIIFFQLFNVKQVQFVIQLQQKERTERGKRLLENPESTRSVRRKLFEDDTAI